MIPALLWLVACGGSGTEAGGGGSDPAGGATNNWTCFVPGTPVATPDGPVAIEDLRPGDAVWSWNLAQGAAVQRAVTHTG
ncbi:MAG: hypothetical protein ACI9K2_005853, partial [Myxococcota bacterium]